jgi:peptidoglycan-N-acetylglucosamine deacetylase
MGISEKLARAGVPEVAIRVARVVFRSAKRAATYIPRHTVGAITHVKTRKPVVALTFDDGPDPEWTPPLLALLARYRARATFFLVGRSAQRYPELVRTMREAGHAIGCHSFDHVAFTAISANARRAQLEACERAVPGLLTHKLFRPPFGCLNARTRWELRRAGWRVIIWNISATDWRDDDADTIYARIAGDLRPGSIVLLHDTLHDAENPAYRSRAPMLRAIERLLREQTSYRFVTVPELLRCGRPERVLWNFDVGAEYLATLQPSSSERNDNYDNRTSALQPEPRSAS